MLSRAGGVDPCAVRCSFGPARLPSCVLMSVLAIHPLRPRFRRCGVDRAGTPFRASIDVGAPWHCARACVVGSAVATGISWVRPGLS